MSYCKREGKDKSVFVTREDVEKEQVLSELVEDDTHGIILPNGDINWDCPCLGGMAYGSCGQEFKDAFSCFHNSAEEEKGVDCIPQFKAMQECFLKFPEQYRSFNDDDDDDDESSSEQTTPPPPAHAQDGNESTTSKLEAKDSGSKLEPQTDSRSKTENVESNSGAMLTVAN